MSTKKDHSHARSLRRLLTKKRGATSLASKNEISSGRIINGVALRVVALSPTNGSIAGGTQVTLTGTNLSEVTTVTFAGVAANQVHVINDTTILALTPSHSAGVVDVAVKTAGGGFAVLARGFTYKRDASYLIDDSRSMERARRSIEQDGHRALARVHAREHKEDVASSPAPEGELQNSILQHPFLEMQRFDGIDPNLNPEPPLNSEARREFDNERREQEMEKQLRLGNMPKFSTAPKPSPR